ncbi:hypothetical protein [Pseudaminobacter soli (ex Li et al. 2025)]|uniref:Alkyl hydroperoxide reductase n=1 Tax=Pseudaminobacter soli (ex Li et al. 2025) TaxID=1295366 RepID=A0A2P7S5A2_9HYPH|nr:hypothetical protein [Mesorhizobium soli]PSJ57654.1 hypothetical protein C7I85_22145 [Mesorhizobium soli]
MTTRLLPGDRAPGLRLSRLFNQRQPLFEVTFNRLSAVVLWNAGCAGCLPAVGEIAELGAVQNVPCYGVAVMVRDIERTAAAAEMGSQKAIMALEERPSAVSGLARGWVTRHWLEASGQPGLPAAFLIDGRGVIAWMGDPAEIRDVLPALANGTWDIEAARERWRAAVSDDEIAQLRIVRDVTDALVGGQVTTARELIAGAERQTPSIISDPQFNVLKLQVLAALPDCEAGAVSHYVVAATRFPEDERFQSSLAAIIVANFHKNTTALRTVIDHLSVFDARSADGADSPPDGSMQVWRWLFLAEAQALAGLNEDASVQLKQIATLLHSDDLPERARRRVASEIARITGRMEPLTQRPREPYEA